MEESGREKVLRVSAHPDVTGGFIVIELQDSGKGISKDDIEKVFDPYFTTKADGTGLGLALAYKIIDEHNGTIRFFSTEGEGTTVTVMLPIR